MKRILLAAVLVVCSTPVHADVNMQEGEWEITTEMEGVPFAVPATKVCLTKEDLVPASDQEKDECKEAYRKITGNTVKFKMVCPESESEGEIAYSGATYKGTIKVKSKDEKGKASVMTMKLAGRRLANCSESTVKKQKEQTAKTSAQTILDDSASRILAKIPAHPASYEKAKELCDGGSAYSEIIEEIEKEIANQQVMPSIVLEGKPPKDPIMGELYKLGEELMFDHTWDGYKSFLEKEEAKLKSEVASLDEEASKRLSKCYGMGAAGEEFVRQCENDGRWVEKELKPRFFKAFNRYLSAVGPKWSEYRDKLKQRVKDMEKKTHDSENSSKHPDPYLVSAVKALNMDSVKVFAEISKNACGANIFAVRLPDAFDRPSWENRDYTSPKRAFTSQGRDYTSQKRDASEGGVRMPDNPVKSIRKLFGR